MNEPRVMASTASSRLLLACCVLGLLSTNPTLGQESAEEADGSVKGEIDLGYSSENKNTDTQKARFATKLTRDKDKWRSLGKFNYNFESTDSDTTVENFNIELQQDYRFDELRYAFGKLYYENDDFSGFDYQLTAALGYGYRVLERDNMSLDLEAGPGIRHDELRVGEAEDEFILLAQARYKWDISDTSLFEQFAGVEAGDNTIFRAESSLKMSIIGNLAMRLSVKYKYTQDVAPGLVNDEWESAVSAVYSF